MTNNEDKVGLFDIFDMEIALFLGVETQEYINRIEKLSEYKMMILISGFMSTEEEEKEKAKRIFNTYVL